jgi:hypothetical protein
MLLKSSFWSTRQCNAYHIVSKVQNSFIDVLNLNLINIEACVVFDLYSSQGRRKAGTMRESHTGAKKKKAPNAPNSD